MNKTKLYWSIGLLLAIAIVAVLCILLIPGGDRVKPEYTLYKNATFEQGGIRYGISDKGVIALSLTDREAKTVTLGGWNGGECDAITDEAKTLLAENGDAYKGRIFAVAKGFIKGNKSVEILRIEGEITYFEDACVKNAPGLLRIFLGHDIPRALGGGKACNKEAFKVSDNCRFLVSKIENLLGYVSSLAVYDGRLVYEKDVLYNVRLTVDTEIPYDPVIGEYYVRSTGRFHTNAMLLGVRSVTLSETLPERDSREESLSIEKSTQVFSAGEVVKYDKEKDTAKLTYAGSGTLCYKTLLFVDVSTPFSGAGTTNCASLGVTNGKLSDGEINGTASVYSYLSYAK